MLVLLVTRQVSAAGTNTELNCMARAAGGTLLLRGLAQAPGDDTHDDFAPQFKASPASSVTEQIQQDIKENKVFVYMKVS